MGGVFQIRSYHQLLRVECKQSIDMDRAEAIKFKLMPDGHIRAYDSRTKSGISEGHVYPPPYVVLQPSSPKGTT